MSVSMNLVINRLNAKIKHVTYVTLNMTDINLKGVVHRNKKLVYKDFAMFFQFSINEIIFMTCFNLLETYSINS